jgi:hypothetical protein
MKSEDIFRKHRALYLRLVALALLAWARPSAAQTPSFRPAAVALAVAVDTNGALLAPANFFSANAGRVNDPNALHGTNNLAEVGSAAAARANLGLGSAATNAGAAFQPASANLTNWAAVATNQVGLINASQTWSGTPNFAGGIMLPNQAANLFLAGPASGSGAPGFRALANGDFPASLAPTLGSLAVNTNLSATNGTGTLKYLSFAATSGTPAPVTNSAGAGTGSSATVSAGANDVRGILTVVTGTSPGANVKVVTVLFSQAKAAADAVVILTPANSVTANLSGGGPARVFATNYTTASFEVWSSASALSSGQTLSFHYFCVQ